MDTTYKYYVLIVLVIIFLIVSIWLISNTGKSDPNVRRRQYLRRKQYELVWRTDFSGPIEQSGRFDYVRWAVPSTEPIKCQELGYYTNNKRNLKLKRSRHDECNHSLILETTQDPVTVEDVNSSRYYPFSTTRIISTASFHTGFFVVNLEIQSYQDGVWPYIRLIDPTKYNSNIANINPCISKGDYDRNAYYLFKPLYHQDESLYWTVSGKYDSDKVLKVRPHQTISIGLKWTRNCLKWYLNPKMGLNGRPYGKPISKERLDPSHMDKQMDMVTRNLELGIAVGGNQFNETEEPSEHIGKDRMIIKSINVYQTIEY